MSEIPRVDLQRAYDELFVGIYGYDMLGRYVSPDVPVSLQQFEYAKSNVEQRYQLYNGHPQGLMWVLKYSQLPCMKIIDSKKDAI